MNQLTSTLPGKWTLRASYILTALPVLMMLFSAGMKFAGPPEVVQGFTGQFGYPAASLVPIGILELTSVALYAIPRTAFLGAIVMTGYLGGAVATHVRAGDGGWMPAAILGVLAWLALYLRDVRLRALVPTVTKEL